MRRLLPLVLAVGLGACATTPDVPPPPPPTRFEQSIELQRQWQVGVGATPATESYVLRPAMNAGRIFVASADRRLVGAYAAESGERLWQTSLPHTLSGGVGAGDGIVVVGSREGRVAALDAASGELRWDVAVSSEVMAVPVVAAGVVVVRSGDDRVTGLDVRSGRRLWMHDRTPPVLTLRGTSSPVVAGPLVLVGMDSGRLTAFNLRDGKVVWELEVGTPQGRTELERMVDIDGDPAIYGNDVYVASYQGRLLGAGLQNGRIGWSREFSSYTGLAVDSERVFAVAADGNVWAFDRFSGAAIWRLEQLRGVRLTAPVAVGDYVVLGDNQGYLNWIAVRDGKLVDRMRVGSGAVVQPPLLAGGMLYVLSSGGDLGAYRIPRD